LLTVRGQYPVPFRDTVSIYYVLLDDADVNFRFYNVAGEIVWDHTEAGHMGANLLKWDGVNGAGNRVATGVYIGRVYAKSASRADEAWIRSAVER
jgi:hypothetical protein